MSDTVTPNQNLKFHTQHNTAIIEPNANLKKSAHHKFFSQTR